MIHASKKQLLLGPVLGALLLTALFVPGCGDDESSTDGPGTGGATGGGGGEGGEPAESAVYVVAKHVSTGDAWTTYLDAAAVEQVSELETFDALDDGIEIDGYVTPVVHDGAVYVADSVAPQITRYDLDDANELVEGETVSFLGTGVEGAWNLTVVSDGKAYVFDAPSQRAVAWNPSTMLLTGEEVDLQNPDLDGYDAWYWVDAAKVRNGKLIVPAEYSNAEGGVRASHLVVIDTATDEVTKFVSDERCQPQHVAIELDNGDIHYFPNQGTVIDYYLDVAAPRPTMCSLRVRGGADEFDPDYVLDLGALVGGDEQSGGGVQGAFPDGRGGLYFAVADEERYADAENNGYSFFDLWHYDFEEATAVPNQPAWSGAMSRWTKFEDETIVLNYGLDENDNEYTIVFEGSAEPLNSFTMPGTIEPIARIR